MEQLLVVAFSLGWVVLCLYGLRALIRFLRS